MPAVERDFGAHEADATQARPPVPSVLVVFETEAEARRAWREYARGPRVAAHVVVRCAAEPPSGRFDAGVFVTHGKDQSTRIFVVRGRANP